MLISNNLCDFVDSADIIPAIRTDHAAVSIVFGKIEELKGSGMWKMNANLLDDEEHLNYLDAKIPRWTSEGENGITLFGITRKSKSITNQSFIKGIFTTEFKLQETFDLTSIISIRTN